MTVYIEYVLIDNFVIDYLLLKATFVIMGISISQWRLFLCAFLGAIFALALPLLNFNAVLVGAIKVLFGLLLVTLSARFRNKREFYLSLITFFCLTFLSGGIIIGVFTIFGLDYSAEISVALMFIPVYFVIRFVVAVVKFIYRRKSVMANLYDVEILVDGKSKMGKGFLDTGNALFDGDSPIIVCNFKFAMGLIDNALLKPVKKISVKTATGEKNLTAIKTQAVKIFIADRPHIFNNVTLCVTKNSVGDGYDVILHPHLLKEIDDELSNEVSQKAC